MKRILMKMQETAQRYVEILAEILKVDVTIIDANCIRIGGSGRMRNRIGDMSSYGYVVKSAIEHKELTIMDDPKKSGICRVCPKLSVCDNICEVWLPLCVDEEVIGVLGFVCFEESQKQHFFGNREVFIRFLNQFGELLESKAKDILNEGRNQNVILLLENILNKVDSGILVMDQNLKISRINQAGKKLLFIQELNHKLPPITFHETGNQVQDLLEYSLQIGGFTYLLAGRFYDLDMEEYRKLFVFQKADLTSDENDGAGVRVKPRELNRILGVSSAVVSIREKIQIVAPSVSNVLITGESGTGKELVAVALHGESDRSNYPFVAVNCASIPENLLESELFGYVKGAFTGADAKGRTGLFEAANGGTVFLDEIGDMPLYLQVKLLRVLENREITRLGSNQTVKIDVRLVAATNKDIESMIQAGEFREDLYYRLNVIPMALSPLRERKEDIRVIATSFIERYSAVLNKMVRGIDEDFWRYLERYEWPGNIRELQNTIEYVMNMMPYSGMLEGSLLPGKFFQTNGTVRVEEAIEDLNLENMERQMIKRALAIYGVSPEAKKMIAGKLGIGIATLYRKIKVYQL